MWCCVVPDRVVPGPGLTIYMLQHYLHYLISTFSEPCYNSTPKSHTNPKKSHQPQKVTLSPQKVKKVTKKSKKKLGPFCYKNVEKMFYQPQKVIFSPQKVKKVKKVEIFFFLFFTYCVRKSHNYTYIFGFGPLSPSINNTY